MDKEKLPLKIKENLTKAYAKDKLHIVLRSDIVQEGQYGEEWLIVSSKRLLVLSFNGKILFNFKLDQIKNVEAVDLVGSGAIEIKLRKRLRRIIMFSNAKTPYFYEAVEDINQLIKGREILSKTATAKQIICETCHQPIPEFMNKCPRCTDKTKTLIRIVSFSKPYTKIIILTLLVTAISALFGLINPYLIKLFIDYILKPNSELNQAVHVANATAIGAKHMLFHFDINSWIIAHLLKPDLQSISGFKYGKYLSIVSIVLFSSYVFTFLFNGFQESLCGVLGYKTVYDVRSSIYEKLQDLSLSYFDKHQIGSILSRVNQDTDELRKLLVDFFPLTLEALFLFFGVGAFLLFISWRLTIIVLIPVILNAIFLATIFPKVWFYFHKFFHKRSQLSALVNDSVSGMRVIKAFGQEKIEVEKFNKRSGDFSNAGIELTNQWAVYHPPLHILRLLGSVMVWYFGGRFLFKAQLTIGDLMAYSGYLMMFYRPVEILTRMVESISNSLSAAERVFDVIDTEPEIKDAKEAVSIEEIKGSIEFKNATFGYNKFKPVIKNMSVKIFPNEMIGLVGRSGAGKSTFINLICRLYDVNKGEILIDEKNIKDIKVSDLRSQIGIVLQETFLFNGTIYDNIAYAKPNATRDEVLNASIAANAHEFIIKKQDGYDTDVGERGNNLSGGEKQMVSIARAILRNPRILILDEATSSVDVQTEKKIQDALEKLTKSRTTIAIAHRLSTLRNCNRIIVIKEGKIIETGTHKQLMNKKGLFSKLILMQRDFSKQAMNAKAV